MKDMVNKRGFTLVELSLSLAFIGVLSITMVLIINNTMLAYQRGVTLNRINDVGMELVNDMRAAAQGVSIKAGCGGASTDEMLKCMFFVRLGGDVSVNGKSLKDVPLYGGFCTGEYSYIWASKDLMDLEKGPGEGSYIRVNEVAGFGLIKTRDEGTNTICAKYNSGDMGPRYFSNASSARSEVLLAGGSNLAIYNLSMSTPAISNDAKRMYYMISFVLGTKDGGANVMATGNYCTPPEGSNSNFNYCAINKFNFAVQAGGVK